LLKGRFCTVRVDGCDRRVSLAENLLTRMRRYQGLVYCPNEDVSADELNLWRGFAVDAVEGRWLLMREHIREVLASNDGDSDRYIYNWLAWCVQHRGERAEVALVIAGGKGTGKGTLGNAMRRMFGAHATHISSRKHLTSGFNRHLMHCSFLFCDEAY